jgi:CelD/BcsL family acetyltransferase involved in cellulose biosynthesis
MEELGAVLLNLDDGATQAALDELHVAINAGPSVRLPWLLAWREAWPEWRPWVLGIRGRGGELRGVAPLALRRDRALLKVQLLAHDRVDTCPVVYRSPADGVALARAVADGLPGLARMWNLDVRQLPSGCAFAAELTRRLPITELRHGRMQPVVMVGGTIDPRTLLSANLRKADAKARNRITRGGYELTERWTREPEEIRERLPGVVEIHRARDLQLRGWSELDKPHVGTFFDALLRRHLNQLALLEVLIDEQLAAYAVMVRQGRTSLVLDNRVSPRWTNYSAGLIANNTVVRDAALDPGVAVLDWGAGVQRYKLQSANRVIDHHELLAWSSEAVRQAARLRDVAVQAAGRLPLERLGVGR